MHLPQRDGRLTGECFDLGVEARLVPGGLVLVNQSMGDRPVDDRHSSGVSSLGRLLLTTVDGGNDFFERGAERRTLAGVTLPARFCLFGALARLGCICHLRVNLNKLVRKIRRGTMPIQLFDVNKIMSCGAPPDLHAGRHLARP